MNTYAAEAPTVATAATLDNAIMQLWNPSASKRLYVREVHIFKTTGAAANFAPLIRRSSARGTVTTSYTPDITNDLNHGLAPESGCTIDLTFTAQPTFLGTATRGLFGTVLPAAVGTGFVWVFPAPITVKAGQGLALTTGDAVIFPVSLGTWVWDE